MFTSSLQKGQVSLFFAQALENENTPPPSKTYIRTNTIQVYAFYVHRYLGSSSHVNALVYELLIVQKRASPYATSSPLEDVHIVPLPFPPLMHTSILCVCTPGPRDIPTTHAK